MKKDTDPTPGFVIYKFKKMQIISPSELRNNSTRAYNKQSSSYKFFLRELEDSLLDNSFDLEKYEETIEKAKSMYEMVIGYSQTEDFLQDDAEIVVIEATNDMIQRYAAILLAKRDSHIYCQESYLELVKSSSDKVIVK